MSYWEARFSEGRCVTMQTVTVFLVSDMLVHLAEMCIVITTGNDVTEYLITTKLQRYINCFSSPYFSELITKIKVSLSKCLL